jgi:hypothetical protein
MFVRGYCRSAKTLSRSGRSLKQYLTSRAEWEQYSGAERFSFHSLDHANPSSQYPQQLGVHAQHGEQRPEGPDGHNDQTRLACMDSRDKIPRLLPPPPPPSPPFPSTVSSSSLPECSFAKRFPSVPPALPEVLQYIKITIAALMCRHSGQVAAKAAGRMQRHHFLPRTSNRSRSLRRRHRHRHRHTSWESAAV